MPREVPREAPQPTDAEQMLQTYVMIERMWVAGYDDKRGSLKATSNMLRSQIVKRMNGHA